MNTRISGKQWAARITTAVAVGSLASAGVVAVAVDTATKTHAATTNSGPNQDDGTLQNPGTGQDNGYYGGYSGGSTVQPGTGGTVHGRSSGS